MAAITWTRSPTDQPPAPSPTSATSPATSWPSTRGGLRLGWPERQILASVPQAEQLRTRITSSPGPADGLGGVLDPDVPGRVEAHHPHSSVLLAVPLDRMSQANRTIARQATCRDGARWHVGVGSALDPGGTDGCERRGRNQQDVGWRTGRRAEVRDLPVRHDHAEHRRLHRLGLHHRVLHRDGLDPGRGARRLRHERRRRAQHRPGRADDHLHAAAADRHAGRPDGLWGPGRRGRGGGHHGRDRRHRHSDVPGRDDHGAVRRLVHEARRQAVGRQDQARLRDAGQQLLRRASWRRRWPWSGTSCSGRPSRPSRTRSATASTGWSTTACSRWPASSSSPPRCCS